jgi:3-deoxy-manno-octulosonate cytidylyltransferase (CMP-KDO synthetase)
VKTAIVIPTRYESKRFPGKALAKIGERPLIEHVYRQAQKVRGVERVLVATDDRRIQKAVEEFGGEAVMTSAEHKCGTERVAEVAESLEAEVIVNLQGDEPRIDPRSIEQSTRGPSSRSSRPWPTIPSCPWPPSRPA